MNKKKCDCKRFREAVNNYEIKKFIYPSGVVKYSFCSVEGIESRIFYCFWCGGELCQ